MRLSLLQPRIIRGDIEHNLKAVQRLVNQGKGDLLVLPEYVLTGSLVLDPGADVREWALRSAEAKARITLPKGKHLLINTLAELDGKLYNCSELVPTGGIYCKLFPDRTELDAGISSGTQQKVFELSGKRFKVLICYDLEHLNKIPTDNLDFVLFIYHFTRDNLSRVMQVVKKVSKTIGMPVLASSLVSDVNNGYSSFVSGDTAVSLPEQEGVLEVEI